MYLEPRSNASCAGSSTRICRTLRRSGAKAAPYTAPPRASTRCASSEKMPPLELLRRSASSRQRAASARRTGRLSFSPATGQTAPQAPQFRHRLPSVSGYKKPSSSGRSAIAPAAQTAAQVPQPVQDILSQRKVFMGRSPPVKQFIQRVQ